MSDQFDGLSVKEVAEQMLPTGSQWVHHTGRVYQVDGIYYEADLDVYFVAHHNVETGEKFARTVANFTGSKGDQPRFVIADC